MINRIGGGFRVVADDLRFITETVDEAMHRRFSEVKRFVYIHDFSLVEHYEIGARKLITDWGKASQSQGIVELVVLIPPKLNQVVRVGVLAGLSALRVFGMNIRLGEDLTSVLVEHSLKPAGG